MTPTEILLATVGTAVLIVVVGVIANVLGEIFTKD